MTKILATMFVALCIVLLLPAYTAADYILAPEPPVTAPLPVEITLPKTPKDWLVHYSIAYGADASLVTSMSRCESQFNPNAKGDYVGGVYRARNIVQYHKETFYKHASIMGEKLDYNKTEDHARLIAWVAANRPDLLNAWTSYRAIKNGGVYKFYSKLLKRNFTVECKKTAVV